ncbi:MAG: class I SAM-dependent methyltransferase [Cyclobacteriaceae bacterium]
MQKYDLIPRSKCPICNYKVSKRLFEVLPEYFLSNNTTIDIKKLETSGLLSLDNIWLLQCKNCALVYNEKVLSAQWQEKFWKEVFIPSKSREKIYNPKKRIEFYRRSFEFTHYSLSKKGHVQLNVIDYGAGWGDFLSVISSDGINAIGIEIDSDKIAYSKKNGINVVESIELISNTKFNIFHSDQVFEHLENPQAHIDLIKPYLDDDFIGYISVPNYNQDRINELIKKADDKTIIDKDLIVWDHLNFFSPETLHYFLDKNGFEVVNIKNGEAIETPENTSVYFRNKRTPTIGAPKARFFNRMIQYLKAPK